MFKSPENNPYLNTPPNKEDTYKVAYKAFPNHILTPGKSDVTWSKTLSPINVDDLKSLEPGRLGRFILKLFQTLAPSLAPLKLLVVWVATVLALYSFMGYLIGNKGNETAPVHYYHYSEPSHLTPDDYGPNQYLTIY